MFTRLSAPLTVFLAVTNSCNLRCVYCSASAGARNENDLSPEELQGVIDELIELGVFKVIITGGEPFIRKDIFDLLGRLVAARTSISIISNGTLITDEIAEQLVEMNLKNISISLDDSTAAINDQTRGDGAFERTLSGIRTLIRHGIEPAILVTVTQANHHRIVDIVEEMKGFQVRSVAFNLMAPIGRGASCSTLTLRGGQIDRVRELMAEAKRDHGHFTKEGFLFWYGYPRRLEQLQERPRTDKPVMLPCDAAKASCAIAADGTVYPCNRFEGYSCGSLRAQSLLDIWRGERMKRVRSLGGLATRDAKGCSACKYNEVCAGGCRADAYARYHDLQAPDPHCLVLDDSAVHGYGPGRRSQSVVRNEESGFSMPGLMEGDGHSSPASRRQS